jgi:hypothetical protein
MWNRENKSLEDGGAGVTVARPELATQVLAAMVIDLIRVVLGPGHAAAFMALAKQLLSSSPASPFSS